MRLFASILFVLCQIFLRWDCVLLGLLACKRILLLLCQRLITLVTNGDLPCHSSRAEHMQPAWTLGVLHCLDVNGDWVMRGAARPELPSSAWT